MMNSVLYNYRFHTIANCISFDTKLLYSISYSITNIIFIIKVFQQRFGWYVLRPSSGVCRTREPSRNFELRPLLKPRGSPVLIPFAITGIPILLLACSEDWTRNLQMIVSLEAQGTNAYNSYAMCPAWLFRVNFWVL